MAFINILKALTPAVTLVASMLLGLERPSLLVAASLVLMAAGTALATAQARTFFSAELAAGCCGGWGVEGFAEGAAALCYYLQLVKLLGSLQEAATSHFSWMGFIMFLLSILFEALRCAEPALAACCACLSPCCSA